MNQWARRTAAVHRELADIAELGGDPRWWLIAGSAALAWRDRGTYVASDAEPAADTFVGHPAEPPADAMADAIARAHAARAALLELDGQLPDQPLAVTVRRTRYGAVTEPSALRVAALAIGDRIELVRLGDSRPSFSPADAGEVPFVTISVGDEPIETARHGHRRGWATNGVSRGPWLGLSRSAGLDIVSTCHMVVDGYGHVSLAARIGEHARRLLPLVDPESIIRRRAIPPLAPAIDEFPLGISWRPLDRATRALPLSYALGCLLHRVAGVPSAAFSPTFQIPVAPGAAGDPRRRLRRHVPATASVRFADGRPEPFGAFAARTRILLEREAGGDGLTTRLRAALRGIPIPLAWKRQALGSVRPGWLDSIASVIGGRGMLSRIRVEPPVPISCAVSSPSMLASPRDPDGGCVVTVIDDGERAAITLCGSGFAGTSTRAEQLLDELLELLPA